MRILCDMDEVAVDLLSEWLRVYNNEWNDCLSAVDINQWEMHKMVKPACGKKIYDIIKRPGFFDHLPAHDGAVAGITYLVEAGHDVRFATAPPGADGCRGKVEWVMRKFAHLGFTIKHVILLHDKEWLAPSVDVLIDDKPQTVRDWAGLPRPRPKIITVAHPYNEYVHDIADHVARDWDDMESAWDSIVNTIEEWNRQ